VAPPVSEKPPRIVRAGRGGGPRSSFEYVEGWGMAVGAHSRVLRPRSIEELRACFDLARRERTTLGLRGSGCSYGDASVNEGGHVLELGRMNRFLDWNPDTGVATLEPGVTIETLWKRILPDGWWPKVVSGTMFPTIAGALAMNIHGKNNFAVGTIGDAVREFDLVLPSGEVRTCSREVHSDLFHAAIGGFGMLGVFTRIVIEAKKVHSGDLEVTAISVRDLAETMQQFEERKADSDYLVSWVDCFGAGDAIGRGLIHQARYLEEGEDEDPARTLSVAHQELPANILGVVPKSEAWRALRLLNNDPGMRFVNWSKYVSGKLEAMAGPVRQPHAAFAFLLDYVPNWKWAYGRTERAGLIQYQSFLPNATARAVYTELLERSQRAKLVPYLGVLKRHRPDPFWLTHACDGWSLALDFKVTPANREALWKHCAELTEVVLAAGGRFYFAKDLVIGPRDVERMYPADRLAAFRALKARCDPENLLETNLYRRLFRASG
jgi:decaprenylphospho-beta-D-ribofuranose 2-oxidase